PDVEEAMKWSHPTYCRHGKIVLGTAAFKEHASVHFWRGQELGFETKAGAMGQLGKLTRVDDLPRDLDAMIARAAELAEAAPSPRKTKHPPKPAIEMHPELSAALDKAPKAKATFDAFPPSCRREYLEWVGEAKRDETRAKRIATTIEWLSEGKRRNWKYENC
ncbi:MAG: YdeI/OmpD-associated family protein, partial [Sphingomicrobium sp.]